MKLEKNGKSEKIGKKIEDIFVNNGNRELKIHVKCMSIMYLSCIIYIRYTDYIYVINTVN